MGYLRTTLVSGGGSTGSGLPLNGGKSQVNLNSVRHYGDYPFINMMKAAANWGYGSRSGQPQVHPDDLDIDGYPANPANAPYNTVLFLSRQVDRLGEYILRWDGGGTFADWTGSGITGSSGGGLSSVSGSTNNWCKGTPYTDIANFTIVISATLAAPNNIKNIRFYHIGDQTDFETNGEIFGNELRLRLGQLKPGVLRFMDWQSSNTNTCTTWASNKALTHYSYYTAEFRGAAWGANKWYFGVTTNVGNAYSINTTRGRAPANGDIIQLCFNVDATTSGTCSLTVDAASGGVAINILDKFAGALSTGGNSYPKQYAYGDSGRPNFATLVYVAVIPAWIKYGGDLDAQECGMSNAVPPQLAMQLAARIGAHPWVCAPVHALDPMTDYVPQMATYFRDNAPSWMVPRYEPPNESWNHRGGFYNNGLIRARGAVYGWPNSDPSDYVHGYGKFASTMGQAFDTVYGGNRSKYVFLLGVQTALGSGGGVPNTTNILTSANYVGQAAAPQAGYLKVASKTYVHGVACANYYGPCNQDQPSEGVMATAFAGGDTSQVPAYIALCYQSTPVAGDSSAGYNLTRNQADFAAWKTMAQGQGVQLMEFYEGGFSPDYDSDTQRNALKSAAKYHISLKQVSLDEYAVCTGMSGGGFTARFPSHYFLSDNKWIHGGVSQTVWSLRDDLYEVTDSGQWLAIVTYNT